jgi:hypothetical protein
MPEARPQLLSRPLSLNRSFPLINISKPHNRTCGADTLVRLSFAVSVSCAAGSGTRLPAFSRLLAHAYFLFYASRKFVFKRKHASSNRQIAVALRACGESCPHSTGGKPCSPTCLLPSQGSPPLPGFGRFSERTPRNPGCQLLPWQFRSGGHYRAMGSPAAKAFVIFFAGPHVASDRFTSGIPGFDLRKISIIARPASLLSSPA